MKRRKRGNLHGDRERGVPEVPNVADRRMEFQNSASMVVNEV